MNSHIPSAADLDQQLQLLQDAGWNTGGIWKVIEIKKVGKNVLNALQNHILQGAFYALQADSLPAAYQSTVLDPSQLELMPWQDWHLHFEGRLQHWSEFEAQFRKESEARVNPAQMVRQKAALLRLLNAYCDAHQLLEVYHIKQDSFNASKTDWHDHLSENIVFDLADRMLLVHFGWSS